LCGALNAVRLTDISVEKGRAAAEMMLMGNSIKVALVVDWNGQKIGAASVRGRALRQKNLTVQYFPDLIV
jgi:hypothetical protein